MIFAESSLSESGHSLLVMIKHAVALSAFVQKKDKMFVFYHGLIRIYANNCVGFTSIELRLFFLLDYA